MRLIITDFSTASSRTIVSSMIFVINPTTAIRTASTSALITSLAVVITNEHISKVKKTIYEEKRMDRCKYFTI